MTNGADTNCRTLRTDPRTSEGVPGTGRRGMHGQREVSRQGIVRPTLLICATAGVAVPGLKRAEGVAPRTNRRATK